MNCRTAEPRANHEAHRPFVAEVPAAAHSPAPAPHAHSPPWRPHRLALRNLAHDLRVALALFLPWAGAAQRLPFSGDARAIGLAAGVLVGLSALAGYADAAGRGEPLFNVWGLHVLTTHLAAQAVALFLVAVAAKRPERLAPLLCGLLAVEIVAAAVVPLLSAAHRLAGQTFAVAGMVVLGRITWRELGTTAPRRAVAALAVAGTAWAVAAALPTIALFRSAPERSRLPPLDIERIYVRQDELVRNALSAVRPSTPDVEEMYFVGFASYAAQNVFENEVHHVEALFREKLGAQGRIALLVNSRQTLEELPLANGHNLAAVLRGVAAKMGPEDMLFLHMTSHGSRDHHFSVDFANLRLNDLSAQEIGAMVADAQLPWRVIVVSACFSGGYIGELKSPRALVMTAAREDRMSFGCEHGREYTYFGEALYRDSVTDGDFLTAFDNARRIVEARERREDREPSEPQIWIGEKMAHKLAGGSGTKP